MEGMSAFSKYCAIVERLAIIPSFQLPFGRGEPTQRTVVAGELARGTGTVELDPTDPADLIIGHVPSPSSHRTPFLDGDLHL